MMRFAICDDDAQALAYLEKVVRGWAAKVGQAVGVRLSPSAEAFLFDYDDHPDCDVLLLDIEMGGMDGVALARRVRAGNRDVQIVFITGFPDFIAEGYEVEAMHYLMKPVAPEKLFAVLDRAAANLRKVPRTVLFRTGGETLRVAVDEIMVAEAAAHSLVVWTVKQTFDIRMSISQAEALLGEGFVRCHRSYLVGLRHVLRITRTSVALDNGQEIPLAKSVYAQVNRAFIDYHRRAES